MIAYSCLLSVARPQTAPIAGTNARALCSVRCWLRSDGLGSRSQVMAPSS